MNNTKSNKPNFSTDISNSLYDIEETIKNTGELFSLLMFTTISEKGTQNSDELLVCILRNINKINDELETAISISI